MYGVYYTWLFKFVLLSNIAKVCICTKFYSLFSRGEKTEFFKFLHSN